MQIILLEKVTNVGNLGDVVQVKNGFARNYLIPQKKAKRATKQSLAEFEARRAELERIQAEKLAAAEAIYARLNDQTVEIAQKAGVDGRLFGSVTSQDIVDGLKKSGFSDIVKSSVRLADGPLKTTGIFPVSIALHTDVVAEISVRVVPDEA